MVIQVANASEQVGLSTELEPNATTVVLNLWVVSPGNQMALSQGQPKSIRKHTHLHYDS